MTIYFGVGSTRGREPCSCSAGVYARFCLYWMATFTARWISQVYASKRCSLSKLFGLIHLLDGTYNLRRFKYMWALSSVQNVDYLKRTKSTMCRHLSDTLALLYFLKNEIISYLLGFGLVSCRDGGLGWGFPPMYKWCREILRDEYCGSMDQRTSTNQCLRISWLSKQSHWNIILWIKMGKPSGVWIRVRRCFGYLIS